MSTSQPRATAGGDSSLVPRLRVLIVMELGGNWGHLLRLHPVVDELRARGHAVTLATPDVAAARSIFVDGDIELAVWPALRGRMAQPSGRPFLHYAQVLDHCVFGDARTLRISVQRWISHLKRLRPDVILADFAPGALLAAHLRQVPVVQLATGWESPPAGEPLPFLRPGIVGDRKRLERVEAALLERLNFECALARVAPLRQVSDLYATAGRLLATWPDIDHFGPRTGVDYVGPVYTEDLGAQVDWPEQSSGRPRVVVYLARDPRNSEIVQALGRFGAEVVAVLPGIPSDEADRLRLTRVRVFDRPIRLTRLVAHARLVVTNGGHGLMGACLRAGVPMLLLPRVAEQALLAARLVHAGVAMSLVRADRGGALELDVIERALADNGMSERSQAFARSLAGTSVHDAVRAAVATVERVAPVQRQAGPPRTRVQGVAAPASD